MRDPFCACRSVQEDVYEKDNLQRCLTVFQDFDERLLEVLRDTDPSTVTEHGLYERPVDKMPDEVCPASQSWRSTYLAVIVASLSGNTMLSTAIFRALSLDMHAKTGTPKNTECWEIWDPADVLIETQISEFLWVCDQGWCRGNVTIIGDAAHAGLPNGQGLNLAIEDGESLLPALHSPCAALRSQTCDQYDSIAAGWFCQLHFQVDVSHFMYNLCFIRKGVCRRCCAGVAFEGRGRQSRVTAEVQCRERPPSA